MEVILVHYLHKILVYIPDFYDEKEIPTQLGVRHHAYEATEQFAGDVFDWRETNTAGRWEGDYPENVIFAKDDVDLFIHELEVCLEQQNSVIDDSLRQIKTELGTNIDAIVASVGDKNYKAFYLKLLGNILYGVYMIDSCFYDCHKCTARITAKDISDIKENPNDWALVMFDYHW